jgi:hypothetical protein
MTGFRNVKELTDAELAGQTLIRSFRKQPTQTTASGIWFDLSMSPGNPSPNYYIGTPCVFTPLKRSTDGGLDHGQAVNALGYKKFLRRLMVLTPTSTAAPNTLILLDYLGFYGFIDESVTDEQFLDNTEPLPRYADGKGIMMMPVVVAGHSGAPVRFSVNYTNSDGVAGRISQTMTQTTQIVNGTILTSLATSTPTENYAGPFIQLQIGDSGVQTVQSVTMQGTGDVGLFALVLVKPIATMTLAGTDAPSERDFFAELSSMPEIKDDAYLNFISLPTGTLAGAPFHGMIETIWG